VTTPVTLVVRMPRLLARTLLPLLALLPFAAFEAALQLADAAPPRPRPIHIFTADEDDRMESGEGRFRPHPRWLWEPRPGAEMDGDVVNDDCRRGERTPLERGAALRIATLGDSSTFGMTVRDAECFARRLPELIASRGGTADVVNDGCIGYSAVQGLAIYRGKTGRWKPDVVIAAFGAVNEHFQAASAVGDFDKIALFSSPMREARSWLTRFDSFRALEVLVAKDPGATGMPSFKARPRVTLEEFERALRELRLAVAEDGAKLLLVVPPRRPDAEVGFKSIVAYSDALPGIAQRIDVPLLDLRAPFRELDEQDPGVAAAPKDSPRFNDAFHPSAEGHRLYALALYAELDRLGWLVPDREGIR
jgi:hypothetical protein